MPDPDFPDLPPPPELPPEVPVPVGDLGTTDRGDEAADAGENLPGRPPDLEEANRLEQQAQQERQQQEQEWDDLSDGGADKTGQFLDFDDIRYGHGRDDL